jgi:hypothetical protein
VLVLAGKLAQVEFSGNKRNREERD